MKRLLTAMLLVCFLKAFSQHHPPLVFTYNNAKIELTTSADKSQCVLKKGKINLITMNTQNFDTRVMTCSGPGLRFFKPVNPEQTVILWEIDLTNWLDNKPYQFFFNYRGKKTQFSGKLEIPVE